MIRTLWIAFWRWYWLWSIERARERRMELIAQKIEDDQWVDQQEDRARRALEKLNERNRDAVHLA